MGPRRLWSHDNFEDRLQEECERAVESGVPFALARLRFRAPRTGRRSCRSWPATCRRRTCSPAMGRATTRSCCSNPTSRKRSAWSIMCSRCAGPRGSRAMRRWPGTRATGVPSMRWSRAPTRCVKLRIGPGRRRAARSSSAGMQRVRGMAVRAASSSINVLILGETGVGKEVLARLIHQLSPRADKPFLAAQLRGALRERCSRASCSATSAARSPARSAAKPGLLETADGGTVFLDEIGEMPLAMQAKLLRVIETREVLRGRRRSSRAPIDVRFIAATNRDLEQEVLQGRVPLGPATSASTASRWRSRRCASESTRSRRWRDDFRGSGLPRSGARQRRASGDEALELPARLRLAGQHPRAART